MFLLGFLTALVFFMAVLPWALSRGRPAVTIARKSADFESQSVLSFSFIMPVVVMALVFAIIVGSRITRELIQQGHGEFVFFSLVFPVFGFLIGYLYLKKQVMK